ncbi:hypothetical protein A8709_17400 [Paenibacillus pectinilyticus]|uniref:Dockerin domain-containing protein n=1 Tax=Paenibacillus pectinilyticus TaxID=512399 RepID=A0A1C0ZZ64_9BACL|nr:DUF5695 domain-containing protein [Paenibacillus pectinilyticus]OCT13389.1 hypothetical protein A8709_17400 [Paenibacillus pectinilyticus]
MDRKMFCDGQNMAVVNGRMRTTKLIAKTTTMLFLLTGLFLLVMIHFVSAATPTYTMSNNFFNIQIGPNGEINTLKLVNDAFPTNYVMNATSAPNQNTPDHEWMGELMFNYRLSDTSGAFSGGYTPALTNQSSDVRVINQDSTGVTVNYANSANAQGIKNFKVSEKYSLANDAFQWQITVKNPSSTQSLELGDFGLPLPFNEYWTVPSGTEIYETQVMHHSYVGNDGSYIYATRPSGIGSMLLMTPDTSTGAGFEYMDHWRVMEHPGSTWAQDQGGWANGLNVYYIHSNVIKSTNRGYLPNTSLVLAPGESKTYAFKFYSVADQLSMQKKLYDTGLIDVVSIPGMIFPTDMTAKVDLHTSQTIDSLDLPTGATMTFLNKVTDPNDGSTHNIYSLSLSQLGPNNVTVHYAGSKKTTLQFYAIEPVGSALQRHASFIVNNTQVNDSTKYYNKIFDDWIMDGKKKRTDYQNPGTNAAGWGDDWGWTHGEFLAEKQVYLPVPTEITAVDQYLETAIWGYLMRNHQTDFKINDWFTQTDTGSNYNRSFAYAHAWNTFFSMYKTEKLHPNAITYLHDRNTYLLRAYGIFVAGQGLSMSTGLMGEQTDMEIVQALTDEGFTAQAANAQSILKTKYNNFTKSKYPFGSEYNFDNTGEESVYTLAKANNNTAFMQLINSKTRADRGSQPLWYYYADPTTITGEAWWNFQYSVSLIDIAMDDWIKSNHSTNPEIDERLNYAAKLANLSVINSGQIDADPANIGTVAWTYQSEKGNYYQTGGFEPSNPKLHNNWRGMSGEADLGLFGEIRVLSSDITTDPIFGTICYGCELSDNGTSYTVTPKDGINQRLNLITKKIYMTLGQDQYSSATVDYVNKNNVHMTLNNVDLTAHNTKMTISGLTAGSYDVLVNNTKVSSFKQNAGQLTTATLILDAGATSDIVIQAGVTPPNTAPIVSAGTDSSITLPDPVTLNGTASDDGYPNGVLNTTWSVQSQPAGANVTIANPSALGTTAAVSTAGTYVFQLLADDGTLQSTSTVTITVNAAPAVPEVVANYKFNETSGTSASDSSGSGNTAALNGAGATFAAPTGNAFTGSSYVPGSNGNSVKLDGSTGFATLPANIVRNLNDFTISTWVNVKTNSNFARLFDFGTGTTKYMFFAPTNGTNSIFAITLAGNGAGGEQQLKGPVLTTGVWHHIAITHQGNTGKLYVDGSLANTNTSMTNAPSSMGGTANNWIGKSQYGDPLLNGQIDNFMIYSRALSDNEIDVLAGLPPATVITSITNPTSVTTAVNLAPVLPTTVSAKYDNGATQAVAVTWNPIDPASYAATGSFTVQGSVAGSALSPTLTINVAAINTIVTPNAVSTPVGTATVLPTAVTATLVGGGNLSVPVTWDPIVPTKYAVKGSFVVNGTVTGTSYVTQITVNVTSSIVSFVNPANVVTPVNVSPVSQFPSQVLANYSDGTSAMVNVTWGAVNAASYAIQNSNPVTITGTVTGTSLLANIKFTVSGAVPVSVNDVYVSTREHVQPTLPAVLDAVLTDSSIGSVSVTWNAIDPVTLTAGSTFTVIGHVAGSTTVTVTAHVTVTSTDAVVNPVAPIAISTQESVAPVFPQTTTLTYSDGTSSTVAVQWPVLPAQSYATATQFTVQGTVLGGLSEAQPIYVSAVVTVVPSTLVSIAPIYVSTTLGNAPSLPATVNGTYSNGTVKATSVTWNLDPTKYSNSTYTVTGTVAGSTVQAVANVGVPIPGLALWYKFNEAGGTTINDSSYNGSTGTLNNPATWTTGVFNATNPADRAITESNTYVTVPSNPNLQTKSMTTSFWIKRTGTVSTEAVVYWSKPSGNYASNGFYITFNGNLIVTLNGTTTFSNSSVTPASFALNTWTNVVVSWDDASKNGKIYVNGVLKSTTNLPSAALTVDGNAKWLGFNSPGYGGGYLNNMAFDDFRIYNSALDDASVAAIYNNSPVVASLTPVTATTTIGVQPVLPSVVSAVYQDGTNAQLPVVWNVIPAAQLAQAGTITVNGTVTGTSKLAVATVTVTKVPVTSIIVTGASNATTVVNGTTLQMSAGVLPVGASNPTVTWLVTNGTGSATIDANGLLTATGVGTVTVTAAATDGSGITGTLLITIEDIAVPLPTAADIAAGITSIAAPAKDATSVTLPSVPDGYSLTVKISDHLAVIQLDGTINPPSDETTVNLILEVTRTSDNTKAVTNSLPVIVPAKTVVAVPTATLSVTGAVYPGQSFDLTYGLSSISSIVSDGIYAEDLTVNYDPAQLQLSAVTSLMDGIFVAQSGTPGHIRILSASEGGTHALTNSNSGAILKLSFQANPSAQSASSIVSLSNVIVSDSHGVETQVQGATSSVQITVVDKSALTTLIASAQAKYNAAVEGSNPGQYPVGSKAALQAAIAKAQMVVDNTTATPEQVTQAAIDLNASTQSFLASINVALPGDLNGDSKFSIGDLAIVASHYGETSSDPNWLASADMNHDGVIDIIDLAAVAHNLVVQ